VSGNISYVVGTLSTSPKTTSLQIAKFTTDPYLVTRQFLGQITLGLCYDGFLGEDDNLFTETSDEGSSTVTKNVLPLGDKYGVQINLKNTTTARDVSTDHNLYIDCIELVPHRY
ncbi:MAG: hypothetical protein WCR36_07010, partial [Bacteroidaceae bacterium]